MFPFIPSSLSVLLYMGLNLIIHVFSSSDHLIFPLYLLIWVNYTNFKTLNHLYYWYKPHLVIICLIFINHYLSVFKYFYNFLIREITLWFLLCAFSLSNIDIQMILASLRKLVVTLLFSRSLCKISIIFSLFGKNPLVKWHYLKKLGE